MLEKFDKKKDTLVKDLQRQRKAEKRRRKEFKEINSSMTEQVKMLKDSEGTIKDLKRKLIEERDLRRESEAKLRKITERSEIAKKQSFVDFVDINFQQMTV